MTKWPNGRRHPRDSCACKNSQCFCFSFCVVQEQLQQCLWPHPQLICMPTESREGILTSQCNGVSPCKVLACRIATSPAMSPVKWRLRWCLCPSLSSLGLILTPPPKSSLRKDILLQQGNNGSRKLALGRSRLRPICCWQLLGQSCHRCRLLCQFRCRLRVW